MGKLFFFYVFLKGIFCSYGYGYELSIATIFQNEGPYLQEWIEYHKAVGVEHFWLYNDASTDGWRKVLEPYVAEGSVEVVDWPSGSFIRHIENQRNALRDAIEKTKGLTRWLALIDADEFLLPAEEATVTDCLNKHFAEASGVYVNWRHFGTGGLTLEQGESMLLTLQASSHPLHSCNAIGKSIIRPDRARPDELWNTHHFVMEPGAVYYNGDGEPLRFMERNLELDLELDGKSHTRWIRLNHYTMRDEHFFHHTRIPRARGVGIEERLVFEHYQAFNEETDDAIIRFIRRHHPGLEDQLRTRFSND